MELSPEEKKRIYEEEKERLIAQEKVKKELQDEKDKKAKLQAWKKQVVVGVLLFAAIVIIIRGISRDGDKEKSTFDYLTREITRETNELKAELKDLESPQQRVETKKK